VGGPPQLFLASTTAIAVLHTWRASPLHCGDAGWTLRRLLFKIDFDSSPGDVFGALPEGANRVEQFFKLLILRHFAALTGIGPGFSAFSCFL
jgi:hypothetical protein